MTDQTEQFDMDAAPIRVGTVRLKVRNLDAVSAFYRDVLGLTQFESDGQRATLGTGNAPLLYLDGDPDLAPCDPRQADLFHVAFLMSRPDLARWLGHAAAARISLQGASDHIVSEALYLADPEGNGIEVYVDRPPSRWRDGAGRIRKTTDRLDVDDLKRAAGDARWSGFPDDGSIGHVHLQVGDTGEADGFYRDALGFEIMARYPGANFYGSGGYHHQLAGNVWNSRRSGPRAERMAGLAEVELVVNEPDAIETIAARATSEGVNSSKNGDLLTLRDPWGTAITLRH